MTDEQLQSIQSQLFMQFGFKVDLYHDELRRGIIVVREGQNLHPANIVKAFNY